MRFKSLLFSSLIFISTMLSAQKTADFSGTWIQDITKSDDFYKEFNVKCSIVQTPQKISIRTTFSDKNGQEITSRESSFNLDGKEVNTEVDGGINKESAIWSPDKKTLTTKSTRTVGSDVYGSTSAYTLSENGALLTIQTEDINPFGPKVKQVFTRGK